MTEFFYNSWIKLAAFAAVGIIIGVLYDIFRILRISRTGVAAPNGRFFEKIKPKKPAFSPKLHKFFSSADSALLFFEDILFWLLASVSEVLFIFWLSDGEFRIGHLVFTFLGFAAYNFTLGKLILSFAGYIIFFAGCLIFWCFYVIMYPIRACAAALGRCLSRICGKISDYVVKKCSLARRKRFLKEAEHGFHAKL